MTFLLFRPRVLLSLMFHVSSCVAAVTGRGPRLLQDVGRTYGEPFPPGRRFPLLDLDPARPSHCLAQATYSTSRYLPTATAIIHEGYFILL